MTMAVQPFLLSLKGEIVDKIKAIYSMPKN